MVSDASLDSADPMTNELFVHTAHMSSNHACAQDWHFKYPHSTIFDGDNICGRSVGGFWVVWGGKLGKISHPNHCGCYRPMAAMLSPLGTTAPLQMH